MTNQRNERRIRRRGVSAMTGFDVEQLVAIDMHGARGSALRRHLVQVEFPLAVVLAAAIGGYLLSRGGTAGWISGLWLFGIAANYVPLTYYAVQLSRRGRLAAAVAALDDLAAASRYYSIAQLRLLVPYLVAVLASRPRRSTC
jgi:hypothetical protein